MLGGYGQISWYVPSSTPTFLPAPSYPCHVSGSTIKLPYFIAYTLHRMKVVRLSLIHFHLHVGQQDGVQ